jgi:hypothetical protein
VTFDEFACVAEAKGLVAVRFSAQHWQLQGALRPVNYYPDTKTIYVNGQKKAYAWGDGLKAIEVAVSGPESVPYKKTMSGVRRKKRRKQLFSASPYCYWCKELVSEAEASLEHLVPLSKGGSNRIDNTVLAHRACNEARDLAWRTAPKED